MRGGKRVALYARVSTADQTPENQLLDLRAHCARTGWTVVQEFVDKGISGAKKDRPSLDQLMAYVRGRHCDRVLVWRYDRFARSVSHLVSALEYFRERDIDFASYQEGVDTGTSQGQFFFTIIAGMAQFERELIRDRINAGLRRAREQGRRLGRPRLPESKTAEIIALRGQVSQREAAARTGVSKGTIARLWLPPQNHLEIVA